MSSLFQTTNFKMLLFSKYSENSNKILALIKDNNLFETLNINIVCIDNENIRKRILNSDIEINIVPCLLCIKDKIQIEKFEGQELNNWIYYQIQQQQQLLQQQQFIQQQQQQDAMKHHAIQQQPIPIPIPQHQASSQDVLFEKQIPKISEVVESTPIDDLLLDDDDIGEDIDGNIRKIEHENGNVEELSEIAVQEITKKTRKKENKYNNSQSPHDYNEYETKNKKKDQKKLDLLNAAMMMKKSREDEDKNINKNFVTM